MFSNYFNQRALSNNPTPEQAELLRKIAREKTIIHQQDKIVLLDQMDWIINSQLEHESVFYKLFEEYSNFAEKLLNKRMDNGLAMSFSIPISYVDIGFVRQMFNVPEETEDANVIKVASELMKVENNSLELNAEEAEDLFSMELDEILGSMPLRGVHLRDYFQAFSDTALIGDRVAEYEAKSILQGQGQEVLEYWETIKAVKDPYSRLFPDKPDLGGGPPQATRDNKNSAWVPGALQPSV